VKLQVPRLPPDFPSVFVASVEFMRLSKRKAASVPLMSAAWQEIPEFARDDKRKASAHLSSCYRDGQRRWLSAIFIPLGEPRAHDSAFFGGKHLDVR
jgi:hypothetical protein